LRNNPKEEEKEEEKMGKTINLFISLKNKGKK
jgi:hypothetical protein